MFAFHAVWLLFARVWLPHVLSYVQQGANSRVGHTTPPSTPRVVPTYCLIISTLALRCPIAYEKQRSHESIGTRATILHSTTLRAKKNAFGEGSKSIVTYSIYDDGWSSLKESLVGQRMYHIIRNKGDSEWCDCVHIATLVQHVHH